MNRIIWTTFLALTVLLAACAAPATPPPQIQTGEPAAPETGLILSGGVVASAETDPALYTNMSFPISGPIKEVLVKEGDMITAGQLLVSLYSPDLELGVTEAELAAKAAELEYVYWGPRMDRPPERKKQAEAEMILAQKQYETAKASFAQTILLAPFDATVVDIVLQPNEVASPGQTVIILADLAHLQIRTTDLSERDIPRVQIGQSATVYIEALDRTVTGRVARISPIAETVGGDVVYPVIIELDEQPEGLLWGMSAEVEIQTE